MKKIILIIILAFSLIQLRAQTSKLQPKDTLPSIYLGISSGIDNYAGLVAIGSEVRLTNQLFLRIGVGLGGWGNKLSGGLKYETKQTNNWGLGLYYTYSTGIQDFKTNLEVFSDSLGTTENKEVNLDLLNASSLNFSISHNWILRRQNKFYFEFGYAAPISTTPYKVKDGSKLTDNSRGVLKIMQPGGLIISMGFLFALD
ncbi:MAG: hypothetical protein K9J13_15650 [Saprospiraceae bacterium]|nr:hypothetical protein [Saprospiraceae bacterium]